jgi:hypothetical protein
MTQSGHRHAAPPQIPSLDGLVGETEGHGATQVRAVIGVVLLYDFPQYAALDRASAQFRPEVPEYARNTASAVRQFTPGNRPTLGSSGTSAWKKP